MGKKNKNKLSPDKSTPESCKEEGNKAFMA